MCTPEVMLCSICGRLALSHTGFSNFLCVVENSLVLPDHIKHELFVKSWPPVSNKCAVLCWKATLLFLPICMVRRVLLASSQRGKRRLVSCEFCLLFAPEVRGSKLPTTAITSLNMCSAVLEWPQNVQNNAGKEYHQLAAAKTSFLD